MIDAREGLVRFPEAVRIKSPTRTFNLFFYFALDEDGRIWVKSIPGASKATESFAVDWTLFLGTGLPHDLARKDFAQPRRIDSINADLDEVMAVSDQHRHYSLRWFENPVFKEDTAAMTWADQHGWPVPGPLLGDGRVAGSRGWAVGRRTRSFVLFEDVAGRTFDGGGGLSTHYVLMADGTSIAFTDSGLPPDWSHTIGGPDRSTFVAEAMEVSADTIFLINAHGELRTRMIDFDTNGSDTMFFVYSYDRLDSRPDAIAIPAEDWFAHKLIPLEGQAQIATQIAIVLTGRHNCDRELRVAGYDRDRRAGYYVKRIFDQPEGSAVREDRDEWAFVVDATFEIRPDRLLDPADTDPDPERIRSRTSLSAARRAPGARPPRRVGTRDMGFAGELRFEGRLLDVVVEVLDFHLDCSPATLRLSSGDDSIDVTLHTAEKWYHLLRSDPGHDGVPQEFQATLELPPRAARTTNPALCALIDDVLQPYHLRAFAFFAQASEDYLQIESKHAENELPRLALHLTRKDRAYPSFATAKRASLRHDSFVEAARRPELQIDKSLGDVSTRDASALRDKIAKNRRAAHELTRAATAPEREDAATPRWLSPSVLGILRHIAWPWLIKLLMPALPFRNLPGKEAAYYAKNLATNMPPLLQRSRALKELLLSYAQSDLAAALGLIARRTTAYARRLAELEGRLPARKLAYFETFAEAWAAFRFGRCEVTLTRPDGMSIASVSRCTMSDEAIFSPPEPEPRWRFRPPGLSLAVMCGHALGASVVLRVIPTQLEADLFQDSVAGEGLVGRSGRPIRTPVVVHVDLADGTAEARAVLDVIFPTPQLAARQEVTATLVVEAGRFQVLCKEVAIEWHARRALADDGG